MNLNRSWRTAIWISACVLALVFSVVMTITVVSENKRAARARAEKEEAREILSWAKRHREDLKDVPWQLRDARYYQTKEHLDKLISDAEEIAGNR